jgi:hypothetical protein
MTVAFTVAVAFVLILSSSCRSFSFSPLACHSERSEESPHLPLRLPFAVAVAVAVAVAFLPKPTKTARHPERSSTQSNGSLYSSLLLSVLLLVIP